jgi:hypothetical protein
MNRPTAGTFSEISWAGIAAGSSHSPPLKINLLFSAINERIAPKNGQQEIDSR